MDDEFKPRPVAGWYMPAAVASLLFMALGCIIYLLHIFADPAAMPLDQRAAYEAEPTWVTAAFALAVWVGNIVTYCGLALWAGYHLHRGLPVHSAAG